MGARKTAKKLEKADRKVSEAAAAASESRLVRTLGFLSEIGDQPPLRALCGVTIAAGLLRRDAKLAGAGAKMLAAHTVATWMKTGVKRTIDRPRPDTPGDYRMERGDSDEHGLSSFPSGHTAGAVAVAEAFVRVYPDHAIAARSAAAAVSLVQVPRAKHFLGDVAVGAVIGLVAERLLAKAMSRLDDPAHDPIAGAVVAAAELREAAGRR